MANIKRALARHDLFEPRKKGRCQCGLSTPRFGVPNQKNPLYCNKCPTKPLDAVNVRDKRCECGVALPSFGFPGQSRPVYCSRCRPPNAIDIKHRRCQCGFSMNPKFALPGQKTGQWCRKCKHEDAIDLKTKKCECGRCQPIFGMIGERKRRWCKLCKPVEAVNITSRRCSCGLGIPNFALPGHKKPAFCSTCKPPNAIDIKHRRCECKLSLHPLFALPGQTKARWCSRCQMKPINAIDIVNKKCACGSAIPNFGLIGQKKPQYCSRCKPIEAVNVVSKKCECGHHVAFGFVGTSATHCSKCKKQGMLVNPNKSCASCKELATHGNVKRERCETHALPTDFNLIEKPCVSCGLLNVLNQNKLCSSCEPSTFKKYIKRKEVRVADLLKANNIKFTQDHIPNGTECGKERPDFVIDVQTHIVIVECDEDQHKSYQKDCEQKRMFNITQTFGGLPVFWIRYNPDKFRDEHNRKLDISQTKREDHLIEWVRWACENVPLCLGQVVYLFYDGCSFPVKRSDIEVIE